MSSIWEREITEPWVIWESTKFHLQIIYFLVFQLVIYLQVNQRVSGSEKTNSSPCSSNLYFIRFHNLSAQTLILLTKEVLPGWEEAMCPPLLTALLGREILVTCSVISHMMLVCLHWTNKHKQEQVQTTQAGLVLTVHTQMLLYSSMWAVHK